MIFMTSDNEPQFDNWKDAWEYRAGKMRDALMKASEDELLDAISQGKSDMFFQIWHVIGENGTQKSISILEDFLKNRKGKDYDLDRFHCEEALKKINKRTSL